MLDLDRIVLGGPTEATRQPAEVGVNGDPGHAEGVAKHDVGGLAPDSGESDQILQPRRNGSRKERSEEEMGAFRRSQIA